MAINEIPCLNRDALMVFKSVAYLNLLDEYERTGNRLRHHDSKKHRRDVLALAASIPPGEVATVPNENDLQERMRQERNKNPQAPKVQMFPKFSYCNSIF